MKIWKRNAVVSTIVLFVCVALYLSWSYGRIPDEEVNIFDPSQNNLEETSTEGELSEDIGTSIDGLSTDEIDTSYESTYFDEARLNRQQSRDNTLSILAQAADRKDTSQEIRDKAAGEIENVAKNALLEANIESLIKAKGFVDCVAIINQNGVSIVVAAPVGGLTSSDAVKIKDIVLTATSMPTAEVTITEIEV